MTISILHVIAHMEKGGAERQMLMLAEASRHNHFIAVLEENQRDSNVPVVPLQSLRPLDIYLTIQRSIQDLGIDIVQLWLPDRITIPAMFAARKEGCRIISGDRRKVRNYGLGSIRDRLPYINHLAADIVIPNYPHFLPLLSLRRLLNLKKKTHPILNGIKLAPVERPIRTLPTRLLFVGRLVEQKRVRELVETMPRMVRNSGITGLDIVGDGPQEFSIRNAIKELHLDDFVTMHGPLRSWGTHFDPAANLLVLPSASEGMSNTLFEAIAYGFLPVVSRSNELEAILATWPEKPVMFDHKDPSSLVAAIHGLTCQPALAIEASVRKMQSRLSEFSISRMVDSYDTIYEQLMFIDPRQVHL